MHRCASPKTRPPHIVGRVWHEPINIGNVTWLDRWKERLRIRKTEAPEAAEEPKLEMPDKAALLSLRALNQFVRCVLGWKGLQEFLHAAVKKMLHMSNHAARMRKRKPVPYSQRFSWAWSAKLQDLMKRMREYVKDAINTERNTRKGFSILRGRDDRGEPSNVFMTVRFERNRRTCKIETRVIGVYTGAQFNRKREYRHSRAKSHRMARDFRRNKSRLTRR